MLLCHIVHSNPKQPVKLSLLFPLRSPSLSGSLFFINQVGLTGQLNPSWKDICCSIAT
jgi:hypothetical protein